MYGTKGVPYVKILRTYVPACDYIVPYRTEHGVLYTYWYLTVTHMYLLVRSYRLCG